MNVLIREDLRELAIQWAHVLVDDRRLGVEGMDRMLACVREESEALILRAAASEKLPGRPRREVGHG